MVNAIDLNALVSKIDVNAVVSRVDVDSLIESVDLNAVLQNVDVNALVQRIDLNAVVGEIDVEELLRHTEIGSLIAASTTNVVGEVLDVIRSVTVGLDDFVARCVNRLLRRKPDTIPAGPPMLVAAQPVLPVPEHVAIAEGEPVVAAVSRQGQYAGFVSRVAAFLVDIVLAWGIYSLAAAGFDLFFQLVTGHAFKLSHHRGTAEVITGIWLFLYFAVQWTLHGRTIGMGIFGLKVVRKDGRRISGQQAVARTLMLAVAVTFVVISVLWWVFQRERRAPQDLVAGTAVVYNWDARAAHVRWLAGHRREELLSGARG